MVYVFLVVLVLDYKVLLVCVFIVSSASPFPSTPFTTGIVGLVGIDAAGLAFFPARRPSHEGMGLVVFSSGGVLIHGQ